MTDQPLDDAAEARIKEACPRHRLYPTEHEYFSVYLPSCSCPIQRAAIKADREAREPSGELLRGVLCRVAQLLDGWHQDGSAWSEYDESVRREVADLQRTLK